MELAAERHDVVCPMNESDVMEYILSKEGVLLNLGEVPDSVDYIVELTMK